MLVRKNHAGGEGSCWWERIMWLLQDGKLLQSMIFAQKPTFSQNGLPSVRSQHKLQQAIAAHLFQLKNPHEKGPM